ncbi:MAG: RNA methyltransferase [Acidobacteriota bacterium]|nr:RNA methyltransferase [Acidobacteriota bacterium]
MAGTDSTRGLPEEDRGGPAVILVEPQLGENIGAAARAMLNCGLTDLRLVNPRDGWPNPDARASCSGALVVLERARVFSSTAEAAADLRRLWATTARRRDMVKPVVTPREAAREMQGCAAREEPFGVLFGPERTGLHNDDIVLADTVLEVPLNPAFSSLNLAQAVLLVAYEWYQAEPQAPPRQEILAGARPATAEEMQLFFHYLEQDLDQAGFLYPPEKRPIMVRNLRNIFQRAQLTEAEVRTLHGVVRALSGRRNRQREESDKG